MTSAPSGTGPLDTTAKVWFPYWKPRTGARVRLFCFPFAGGSASTLHRWASLGPHVEVVAVQYPGRETRFQEPPFNRLSVLVDALGPVMLPLLDRPFAFFGYSMGTFISLMLAYWLRRSGAPAPRGMMMAAGSPPRLWIPRGTHLLSEEELIGELRRYGSAPPQVLAHRELMQLLLPMVRADFEMLDTFVHPDEPPLSLPISVWGGTEDRKPTPESLEHWRDYTTQDFSLQLIPGGHFFIQTAGEQLRDAVEKTLLRWFPAPT
ncbi:thioesterase II family protein [Hyalangium versicolor]|uniref:thioesterase II family protein n=1 Tax=Hyalangium versicolor TaxID=2861190 RepID=UPI001CCF4343|nr:alpha/beta fold hydrolase [Hyalangium versicolor]